MIKLTIEVDSLKMLSILRSFVAQERFRSKAHIMAAFEMLPYHEGMFRVKLQFEDEHTFLVFVQDWFNDDERD